MVLAQREVSGARCCPVGQRPLGELYDSVAEAEHRPRRGDHGQGDDGVVVGPGLEGEEVADERDHEGQGEGPDQGGEQREAQRVERPGDLQQHQEATPPAAITADVRSCASVVSWSAWAMA